MKVNKTDYYSMNCLACGSTPCDPAHIKSRGSGGKDEHYNIISLCRGHHTLQHKKGWSYMAMEYPKIHEFLFNNGWHFELIDGFYKLRRFNK